MEVPPMPVAAKRSQRPPIPLVIAVVVVLIVGAFWFRAHQQTCRRLNAVRISYLIPGQTTRGPFNLNIKGVGWNDSQVSQYQAADQAFHDAGCA